jgi:adenylate kinase
MKFIFLGPPGVGKGTYSSRIATKMGILHISTGDLFREEVKKGTELGKMVDKIMDSGELVPDEVTIKVLKSRLSIPDAGKGFILDGFPRTIPQAEMLDREMKIDAAINLFLPEELLVKKIAARRVCRKCGDLYNVVTIKQGKIHMPPILPKVEGKCDKCGGELYQRDDDKEEIVKERLDAYREETEPLIDYYRKKGILHDIDVVGSPEVMVPIIMKVLEKYRD